MYIIPNLCQFMSQQCEELLLSKVNYFGLNYFQIYGKVLVLKKEDYETSFD